MIDLSIYPFAAIEESTTPITIDTETAGVTEATNIPIYYSWAAEGQLGSGAGPTTTEQGLKFLIALCESNRPKIFHNASFDLTVLSLIGIKVKGQIEDTILMHMLLDEHHLEYHRLKALSRELLNRSRSDEIDLKLEQKKVKGPLKNMYVPQEILHKYAVADAEDTFTLYQMFLKELKELDLYALYRMEVQVELDYMLIHAAGITIDLLHLEEVLLGLNKPLELLQEQIYAFAGKEFKISSPKQLGTVLEPLFNLTERTPSGNIDTSRPVLEKFITDKRMQAILAWKFLTKAQSTLTGYKKRLGEDGKLHPHYRQTTVTGRSACSNPNLQTIPKQRGRITATEAGSEELATICSEAFRQTRSIFTSSPNRILFSADYKQIEYRCAAHYMQEESILKALQRGEDFHTIVSTLVFGNAIPRNRHIAKIINYAVLYMMGKRAMLERLRNEKIADPEGIFKTYEAKLPSTRQFQKRVLQIGDLRGYVKDVFGRRYRITADKSYKLISWLCQGTAANIKKKALVRCMQLLRSRKTNLILDIHDQFVFDLVQEDICLLPQLKEAMEDFPEFSCPIPVDMEIGFNLLNMQTVQIEDMEKECYKLFQSIA